MSGEGYVGSSACLLANDQAGGLKVHYGRLTPDAAADTVVTGLSQVYAAVACLDGDPDTDANDPVSVSCTIGDQAGTPAAGSIIIKSWADDWSASAANWVAVNWIAIGI